MDNFDTTKETLKLKLDNVIEYLKDKKDIKPNLFEISTFMISIAELDKLSNLDTNDLWNQFDRMTELYNIDKDPIFNSNDEINRLYTNLYQSTKSKSYQIPVDEVERKIKKELISESLKINYYIAESLDKDPKFKYNNEDEYDNYNKLFTTYLNSSEEPEFKEELEANKNYLNEHTINIEKEY